MDNPQGADEFIPFETPADEMEETMEQRYKRMIEQVRRKRIKEGIKALQAELVGDMQALRMEIPGLPIREKRRASSPPLNQPLAQMPRPAKPSTFKERHLKEAVKYEVSWKIHFQATKIMPDADRIALVAMYLDDHARVA
jgi:hypothetical protein